MLRHKDPDLLLSPAPGHRRNLGHVLHLAHRTRHHLRARPPLPPQNRHRHTVDLTRNHPVKVASHRPIQLPMQPTMSIKADKGQYRTNDTAKKTEKQRTQYPRDTEGNHLNTREKKWWQDPELNRGHKDFQAAGGLFVSLYRTSVSRESVSLTQFCDATI